MSRMAKCDTETKQRSPARNRAETMEAEIQYIHWLLDPKNPLCVGHTTHCCKTPTPRMIKACIGLLKSAHCCYTHFSNWMH